METSAQDLRSRLENFPSITDLVSHMAARNVECRLDAMIDPPLASRLHRPGSTLDSAADSVGALAVGKGRETHTTICLRASRGLRMNLRVRRVT